MRILICTQAVDADDPVLGFFLGWLREFSKHFEEVQVVCLKEGQHDLPPNVVVHSLGKESGRSRVKYLFRFYWSVWSLRGKYDAVFVHMNEEYVLLGGVFWKLFGKRVVLWRNHRHGSLFTRFAVALANTVCYTSPDAYVAHYKNAVRMPIGIDTAQFAFIPQRRDASSVLFLGRLDAVKKPDVFLGAMEILAQKGVAGRADIYGDPTPGREAYVSDLKTQFGTLANVSFHPSVRNAETPAIYASHDIYCNLTPSGSFDKTIGEAMASGCLIVCANAAVKNVIGELFVAVLTPEDAARALWHALGLSASEREVIRLSGREYIEREHSLRLLATRLSSILE